jgi:hypothetical protein
MEPGIGPFEAFHLKGQTVLCTLAGFAGGGCWWGLLVRVAGSEGLLVGLAGRKFWQRLQARCVTQRLCICLIGSITDPAVAATHGYLLAGMNNILATCRKKKPMDVQHGHCSVRPFRPVCHVCLVLSAT